MPAMRIATLIPAFKLQFLPELLQNLFNQTRRPDLVILSDDHPEQGFTRALAEPSLQGVVAALKIRVIPGPRRGPYANTVHLLDAWNGQTPLCHVLLDDDFIYPRFYERHLDTHERLTPGFSVSARWSASEKGIPESVLPVPAVVDALADRVSLLDAATLFSTTIPSCTNWLGEYSNAVLDARAARFLKESTLGGVGYHGLQDIGLFLQAATERPFAYIHEPLGAFRVSGAQHSSDIDSVWVRVGHLAWPALAVGALREGQISAEQALTCFHTMAKILQARYAHDAGMLEFARFLGNAQAVDTAIADRFAAAWLGCLQAWGVLL